jgi:glycosyltransferase involved in cell wall biosynthesis
MKPLITALVDTFNQERYIEQAVVSVIEQGLSPSELEILVVDDGSTDTTPAILQKFVPRVKHLRKRNGGQASALNAGFAEAQGEIVALLDGDDWWAEGKLRTVLDHMERNPTDVAVSHAYFEVYEKINRIQICGPRDQSDFLNLGTPEVARYTRERWGFLQPSALTVRRKLLEKVMPIPEVLVFCADSIIATAAMAMGARVLSEPLSYYRIHSDNLYAGDHVDSVKLRRKLEMDDAMYSVLYPRLLRLGVPPECVSILLDVGWISANRLSLSKFGGNPLKTWRTEMCYFRSTCKNPTIPYYLFKYLVMGPATLLLPPRLFYKARDWYAAHDVKRFRDRLFKTEVTPRTDSSHDRFSR